MKLRTAWATPAIDGAARDEVPLRLANRADLGWALCLALGTVAYLWFWPRNLGLYDESILLHEAKRILEGEVPYRDFVEIVTPGAWFLMAAAFRVFGTSIDTARGTMSVLHAISVGVIYLSARALGLIRELAMVPAVAYLALCYVNFPHASPHWFATFFGLVLLLGILIAPVSGPMQRRWMFVLGMLASTLLCFQQQRGLALAAGLPALIVVDRILGPGTEGRYRLLGGLLAAYIAGGLVVALPVLVYLLTVPGFEPAYHGLVYVPLFRYARHIKAPWGLYPRGYFAGVVFPRLFKYLPVLLPAQAIALAVDRLRGANWSGLRRRTLLTLFCLLSIPTVLHYPDYLHISLIAPFFFILAADLLDWTASQLRAPLADSLRIALAAGLLTVLAYQAGRNLQEFRRGFPLTHPTAFGEVSFATRGDLLFVDHVREWIATAPSKEIFVYPHSPGIYLLTGAKNATRYSLLLNGYHASEDFQEIISTLESKRTPSVVFAFSEEPQTAFTRYLRLTYERVRLGANSHFLYRRRGMTSEK